LKLTPLIPIWAQIWTSQMDRNPLNTASLLIFLNSPLALLAGGLKDCWKTSIELYSFNKKWQYDKVTCFFICDKTWCQVFTNLTWVSSKVWSTNDFCTSYPSIFKFKPDFNFQKLPFFKVLLNEKWFNFFRWATQIGVKSNNSR